MGSTLSPAPESLDAPLPLLLPKGFNFAKAKASGTKGLGKIKCPKTIIAYHVCPKNAVKSILKDGFKLGTNKWRCRIGKGVYCFAKLERAIRYAKKVNGKILITALHTKEEIFDTGEKSYFKASWLWGEVGIAVGLHYPSMWQGKDHFHELLKGNPKAMTVLYVGKKKADLPAGSVFKKTHDQIFQNGKPKVKKLKLKCGAEVSYI